MKKIYLFLALTSVISLFTNAQSIITIPGDTSVATGTVTDEFDPLDIHLGVKNNTAQSQTFTWMMKNYSTPSGLWEVKLCDNYNCYDMLLNPGPYESSSVAAGDTMDFKFQFAPHCLNGTGEADVLVFITGDSANTAKLIHFTANITTTCVNAINEAGQKTIRLFPNPVKGSFIVSGLENVGNLLFEVYSLQGQLVKSRVANATENQIEISVETLTNGTYVLRVTNQLGKVVATSRLNKVD
jgi:hypothetical protein